MGDQSTGRHVAIKKTKKLHADQEQVGGIGFMAVREIKLMHAVNDPHIMRCLDVFMVGRSLHLVMDLMDGDLRKVIENRNMILTESHVKCLAKQILCGLATLHRHSFVHRDVTPGNILLNYSSGIARITDFGVSRTVGHGDRPMTPRCTTLRYRAPELLYGARYYGMSVDIWSLGCIFAELILREPFFQGTGEIDMLYKIFEKRGTPSEERWLGVSSLPFFFEFSHNPTPSLSTLLSGTSPSALSLLDGLLSLDPKGRPEATEASEHEFFTSTYLMACVPQQLPFVVLAAAGG